MTNTPSSAAAQTYLEKLMRAGQDATKQFDDAFVLAMGLHLEEGASSVGQLLGLLVPN